MKKKKTKRSETKETKVSIVPSSGGKEEKEKGKKLAGWGGE